MHHTIVEHPGVAQRTGDAKSASTRWKSARWFAAAGCAAAAIAWVSADFLKLSREAFVLPYLLAGASLTALFLRSEHIDPIAAAHRYPIRSILVTAITSSLAVASVLAQPGAPRAHGAQLPFEVLWDGVAYGTIDGVLLTVVPIAAVRRALVAGRWTSDALTLLASVAVFVVYHLGFPEFRSTAIVAPIVAGVLFGAAYLASRNPLTPVVAHVVMHIAAVLHGPAGTVQLPPHY